MADAYEEYVIGSGYLYVDEFSEEIPSDEELEVSDKLLGLISGGASIEYKPTYYEAKDDLGLKSETVVTDEEATLKSGICTFNGNTLAKLSNTARVTESNGIRTVKIGGIGNDNGKKYVIHFVHKSGWPKVTIVGQNQAGFTISFAKDKETVIDAEFKALPCDSDGTLIIYREETGVETLKTLTVTSTAGAESGDTKIEVSPSLTSGNVYVYTTDTIVTAPSLNDVLNGWDVWDGVSDITATTGNEIGIAEVNGNLQCKAFGKTTVTSKS